MKKLKNYEISLSYDGFVVVNVKARNEDEACMKIDDGEWDLKKNVKADLSTGYKIVEIKEVE